MKKIIACITIMASLLTIGFTKPDPQYDYLSTLFEGNDKAIFNDVNTDNPGIISAIYQVQGEDITAVSQWLTEKYGMQPMHKIYYYIPAYTSESWGRGWGWGTGHKSFQGSAFSKHGYDDNYIIVILLDTYVLRKSEMQPDELKDVTTAHLIIKVLDKQILSSKNVNYKHYEKDSDKTLSIGTRHDF